MHVIRLEITASVKAELMKVAIAEARKAKKNIPMVEGKIEVVAEEFAIVEDTGKRFAYLYTAS